MNKLKRVKRLYETSKSYEDGYYECICDEDGEIFGEYFDYEDGGVFNITGFCFKSEWIGLLFHQKNVWHYSFLEPGKQITKEEYDLDYKKYLAKYRLGLYVPDSFLCLFIFLKDYEEPRDFS